ncbi:MAG: hemerythrin domain-containing protein [Aureliella sp.]
MAGRSTEAKFTVNAAFFREIKEDHQQLNCIIDKLRQMVSSPPALANHLTEFAQRTAELRDQLAFHFTLEEAYGYFEDAVERAPRFHDLAGRLRDQHSELYLMAERVAESAESASVHPVDATQSAERISEIFIAFDTALKAHESAEIRLILDAMQVDVGGGD